MMNDEEKTIYVCRRFSNRTCISSVVCTTIVWNQQQKRTNIIQFIYVPANDARDAVLDGFWNQRMNDIMKNEMNQEQNTKVDAVDGRLAAGVVIVVGRTSAQ